MTTISPLKSGDWLLSRSAEETMKLGNALGRTLRKGDVVSLYGPIGGGKTTFVKGLAEGLGIKIDASEVASPTFVLIREYPCRIPLRHIDLYRLDRVEGVDRRLVEECFDAPGVTVIEWAEKAEAFLPDERVEVRFRHETETSRGIRFLVHGKNR